MADQSVPILAVWWEQKPALDGMLLMQPFAHSFIEENLGCLLLNKAPGLDDLHSKFLVHLSPNVIET